MIRKREQHERAMVDLGVARGLGVRPLVRRPLQ